MSQSKFPAKQSIAVKLKEKTARNVKEVQQNYNQTSEKVQKIFDYPVNGDHEKVEKEYEKMLQENVEKLREIAREDFANADVKNRRIIAETKVKIHDLIGGLFQGENSNTQFAETAEKVFEHINMKIKNDLNNKSAAAERHRSLLEPTNVFVYNSNRPQEEIDAEKSLHKLFEDQLMEFNGQILKDLREMREIMKVDVRRTKDRMHGTIRNMANPELFQIESPRASESQKIPNNLFPKGEDFERNLGGVLKNLENDFKKIQQKMNTDVEKRKQEINQSLHYYREKISGITNVFSSDDEDDED